MTERHRVAEVVRAVRGGLPYALSMDHPNDEHHVHEPERVAAWPNQVVVDFKGREFTITVTENRKSRRK